MIVVDSCGWLAYLKDTTQADAYEPYLQDPDLIVPTVVIYEVCKVLRRDISEDAAHRAAALLQGGLVVPLDQLLAMEAAEVSLRQGLAMADAIVYATAQSFGARLVTSDEHFAGLPGVEYLAAP